MSRRQSKILYRATRKARTGTLQQIIIQDRLFDRSAGLVTAKVKLVAIRASIYYACAKKHTQLALRRWNIRHLLIKQEKPKSLIYPAAKHFASADGRTG